MTETPETPAPPADGEGAPTVAQLAERVDQQDSKLDRILEMLGGGGHVAPQAAAAPDPPPVDIGEEVRKATEKLHEKERKQAEKEAADDAALTDKIKKVVEQPPREFKKATEKMGWVGPNDR